MSVGRKRLVLAHIAENDVIVAFDRRGNGREVVVEDVEPEVEGEPWTARFLAPATAVLGLVVFVIVVVYYFVRIRGRYEVVE